MNQKLAFVIFAFAFLVAIVVGFYSPSGDEKPAPSEFRAKFRETMIPTSKPSPSAKAGEGRNPSSVKESEPLHREAFLHKYGEKLSVSAEEGRVTRLDGIAIRNEDLSSEQRVKAFRPSHPGDLIARAREILSDARSLLGIPQDAEFGEPIATPGDSTGQVVFQQTRGGTPVYPGGLVTILMGPDGELRTLDSSIYPSTEITNAPMLPQPGASRTILYVTESAPTAILRYAYETNVKGTQTVTDAQTGVVLFTRSRKIY